ncbi:HlyD family efflux transporter periplasmic adaptor subunit [Paracoccus sp. MBLB3053]|uniref:HlyD family efflux transporter periplasmic adaptor subunit n=1 Tax=Paracoccus aurantius TaxID=3073814 RepID=A0ABU2HZJ1_9RHOB|nr:HlyD family efflux transporter periplasmic adaptor subunit [Paracoccus sp. MBLB3053]MDS9470019.1 HlyD family efflux transporter periplasmic adaptor subunit [Paracoccus sp. MBLB3053]
MKFSRLLIGFLAIILALWIIVGEQMSGASADAVVNARIVTVRADVAGDLSMPNRPLGAKVAKGDILASIIDPLVDSVRLDDLYMESSYSTAEIAQMTAQIDKAKVQKASLEKRSETFRRERLDELRERLDHARNRLELLERGDALDEDGQRLIDAAGEVSGRLPAEPLTHALAIDHARERVALLDIALRSAEAGVFLGDGYNDAPVSEQRAIELGSEIDTLTTRLDEAKARLTALTDRIAREQVRVSGLSGGEILAPISGQFWEVLEADGVNVQRGDPLLRMVDCGSVMVTLSVSERVYNSLRLGGPAKFRLDGQSKLYDGTISRLAGSGAATVYRNLAIAPSQRHLERYDVTLLVPELGASEGGCMIGQTGRVFFDRRPLDWLRSIFS